MKEEVENVKQHELNKSGSEKEEVDEKKRKKLKNEKVEDGYPKESKKINKTIIFIKFF